MPPSESPTHFCTCVERVLGLAAVRAEWRRLLGRDWAWAEALLHSTDRLADCYPVAGPDTARPADYRVVWRDEAADRYVASCPAGSGSVTLRRTDLVVYELDVHGLGRRIADAMGLVADPGDVDGVPHARRVGVRDALTDGEVWVYLALQAGPRDLTDTLHRLAARGGRPAVLITPTQAAWVPWPVGAEAKVRVVAMTDAFVVARDGRWSAVAGEGADLGRPMSPAPQPPPAPVASRAVVGGEAARFGVRVDAATFTVSSGDRTFRFAGRSKLLFSLLARVATQTGRRVTFNELRGPGGVWDDREVEDSTIRGAVARLKRLLVAEGLGDVAAALSTGRYDGVGFALLALPAPPPAGAH